MNAVASGIAVRSKMVFLLATRSVPCSTEVTGVGEGEGEGEAESDNRLSLGIKSAIV